MINFSHKEYDTFLWLEFEIEIIEPTDLKSIDFKKLPFLPQKGVVLAGRGPIWLYGALIHHYHPSRFVATFDPRLNAGVVVESHDKNWAVGDLVAIK